MMETWTLQEGFPLITVEVKGREVRLSQERYLKSDDPSQTSRFNINIKDLHFIYIYDRFVQGLLLKMHVSFLADETVGQL